MKENPILYVVVPCYNEEEVLKETVRQLKLKLTKLQALRDARLRHVQLLLLILKIKQSYKNLLAMMV